MKAVLPIALIGSLAISPAFGAGPDKGSAASPTAIQTAQQSNPGDRVINPRDKPGQGMKDDPTYKPRASDQSGEGMLRQSGSGMQPSQQTVMQVQQRLKQQGYNVGAVDGIMGPQTRQALTQFQREKNLQGSGSLNQQTMASLGLSGGGEMQQADNPAVRNGMRAPQNSPGDRQLNPLDSPSQGMKSDPTFVPRQQ